MRYTVYHSSLYYNLFYKFCMCNLINSSSYSSSTNHQKPITAQMTSVAPHANDEHRQVNSIMDLWPVSGFIWYGRFPPASYLGSPMAAKSVHRSHLIS